MSDIIDFNELKNKVREKDIDDFENYIMSLYSQMGSGTTSFANLNKAINDYMQEHNISQEKFMELQTKLMERYGVSMEDVQKQYNMPDGNYERFRKSLGFTEKYKEKIKNYTGFYYEIRNDLNDLTIFLNEDTVLISSKKKVDMKDNELNEFLVSYKKLNKDAKLKVRISEDVTEYEY
ncbi:MAG TPA: DUF3867 family protein [Clostridiaceae bacterium]|nr:DUF3867 family protein [Clostridiaceae bacterium]